MNKNVSLQDMNEIDLIFFVSASGNAQMCKLIFRRPYLYFSTESRVIRNVDLQINFFEREFRFFFICACGNAPKSFSLIISGVYNLICGCTTYKGKQGVLNWRVFYVRSLFNSDSRFDKKKCLVLFRCDVIVRFTFQTR